MGRTKNYFYKQHKWFYFSNLTTSTPQYMKKLYLHTIQNDYKYFIQKPSRFTINYVKIYFDIYRRGEEKSLHFCDYFVL